MQNDNSFTNDMDDQFDSPDWNCVFDLSGDYDRRSLETITEGLCPHERTAPLECPFPTTRITTKPDLRSRNWFYTFQLQQGENLVPTETELQIQRQAFIEKLQSMRPTYYYVGCVEYAPTTGKTHLHGIVRFSSQKTWSALCKKLPNTWFTVQKGTVNEAITYASKTGMGTEYGIRPLDKPNQAGILARIKVIKHAVDYLLPVPEEDMDTEETTPFATNTDMLPNNFIAALEDIEDAVHELWIYANEYN